MHAGHYISGAGHLTLIGWLLFGGVFRSEPPPFELTEVSVITGAEYDTLLAAQRPPDSTTDVAQPEAPEVTPDAPDVTATGDQTVDQPAPQQTESPLEDTPPEVTELAPPREAEFSDEPPVLDEPVGDVAVLAPERAPEAVPRPLERVAPEAVIQPELDATPRDVPETAVAPDEAGETPEEPQEAQAPPEATTEIVTELTTTPKVSLRPPGRRPSAPQTQVAETITPAPATNTPTPAQKTEDVDAAAIAAAVAAAQVATETPAALAPSGPPLSAGEKESLRVAVSQCWNVGSMSSDALQTTVVLSVAMNTNGTPVSGAIRMLGSSGGSDAAARQAFETARRAIIRCGAKGFPLPVDKYSQWQTIEMTFDPKKMRIK